MISTFWIDEELESPLYLDGVLTFVDAKNIPQQLSIEKGAYVNQVQKQVAFADLLVLNKTDLVSEGAALDGKKEVSP